MLFHKDVKKFYKTKMLWLSDKKYTFAENESQINVLNTSILFKVISNIVKR